MADQDPKVREVAERDERALTSLLHEMWEMSSHGDIWRILAMYGSSKYDGDLPPGPHELTPALVREGIARLRCDLAAEITDGGWGGPLTPEMMRDRQAQVDMLDRLVRTDEEIAKWLECHTDDCRASCDRSCICWSPPYLCPVFGKEGHCDCRDWNPDTGEGTPKMPSTFASIDPDVFRRAMQLATQEQKAKADVQCNLCGFPCTVGKPGSEHQDTRAGLIEATVSGGYESTPGNGWGALDDCTSYTFSLCEFCLDWLFTKCKVPPKTFCNIGGDEPPWVPAADRVEADEWRRFKDEFRRESERRRKARDGIL